jgi:HK97 gp10 family phage protein
MENDNAFFIFITSLFFSRIINIMPFRTSSTTKVQVQGLNEAIELLNMFKQFNAGISSRVLEEIGEEAAYEIAVNAPVDTGFMAGEVRVTELTDTSVTVESPAPYSGFVNFGTKFQEAQPFFSNTVENIQNLDSVQTIEDDSAKFWNDNVNRLKPR